MEKFRVLSDIHLDINESYPLTFDDDIFTVICGDTSGYPKMTIDWIRKNIKNGVGISGNHLPYNDDELPIQKLREKLARAFPATKDFTYLDCETKVFSKEVDGILFIGTCMYTDMSVKHEIWNPTGDRAFNMKCSMSHMNDYHWGIKAREKKPNFVGEMVDTFTHITANDYFEWFKNAYNKIEKVLNENEALENPKPVVLLTHHPLIIDFLKHSTYVENADHLYSAREFNWSSYGSDMKQWLLRHTSIKCYCCGHVHAVEKEYRNFKIEREDGSKILVVNNTRGYVGRGHDYFFNKNTFVNTKTWEVETEPLSEEEQKARDEREKHMFRHMACFI